MRLTHCSGCPCVRNFVENWNFFQFWPGPLDPSPFTICCVRSVHDPVSKSEYRLGWCWRIVVSVGDTWQAECRGLPRWSVRPFWSLINVSDPFRFWSTRAGSWKSAATRVSTNTEQNRFHEIIDLQAGDWQESDLYFGLACLLVVRNHSVTPIGQPSCVWTHISFKSSWSVSISWSFVARGSNFYSVVSRRCTVEWNTVECSETASESFSRILLRMDLFEHYDAAWNI